MKKIKLFQLSLLTLGIILIYSCSSINSDDILGKWWVLQSEDEYDNIVMCFTKEHRLIDLNDQESFNFELQGNKISIKYKDTVAVMKILKLTESELILKAGEKLQTFTQAEDIDFIVGSWKGNLQGGMVNLNFDWNDEVTIETMDGDYRDAIYSFDDGELYLDNIYYEYSFSDDKHSLVLKSLGETYKLLRDY